MLADQYNVLINESNISDFVCLAEISYLLELNTVVDFCRKGKNKLYNNTANDQKNRKIDRNELNASSNRYEYHVLKYVKPMGSPIKGTQMHRILSS